MPCPDTDAPNEPAEPDNTAVDAWHLDGPNPPCAQQVVEHGWLPRHVDVRDGRYHFHTRARQRLHYAVSGQFVNNPIGRIVNPSTEGGFSVGHYSDVIAVLATPPLDQNLADTRFWLSSQTMINAGVSYSLIRIADLRKPSMQRVGGWLVSQLNSAMEQRCASTIASANCGSIAHNLLDCDVGRKTVLLHWLNTEIAPINCENHEQYLLSALTLLEELSLIHI